MGSSRRQFLKMLAGLSTAAISGSFGVGKAELLQASPAAYKVLPWTGDDFTLGHRLRAGCFPTFPDVAERFVDFVIVGGGMAGLTTAYYLRDHDFLLLEQYAQTGGTSSGGSYRGISYSRGAVCTGSDAGLKHQLFQDLNIRPVIISAEDTAWHMGGQWLRSIKGDSTFHRELKRLISEIDRLNGKGLLDEASNAKFSAYLSGYDPQFRALVDNISHSFFCAQSNYISARAGFFMIKALTSDSYVFDGGNSGISSALREALDFKQSTRIKTDSFVWRIKPSEKGASVYFTDSNGEVHRVDCKHVVVAVSPLVAMRILPDLPDSIRGNWEQLEYGAFAVTNLCMPKKVLDYPYQSFVDEPYPFCQMVLAEAPYQLSGRYKPEMGSVLTIYRPFEHGSVGRSELTMVDRERFASSLVDQVSQLFEPLQGNLESIEITRWGHAVLVPKPGLSELLNRSNQYTNEWMTFAHSTASGGQSLDGAVSAARNAVNRCLKVSASI